MRYIIDTLYKALDSILHIFFLAMILLFVAIVLIIIIDVVLYIKRNDYWYQSVKGSSLFRVLSVII